jgi:virginiamycin B lyase
MSERRTDADLNQTLAAWMDEVAPDRLPTRLLEGTFAQTMKTRQARTYPWHKVTIRAGGRPNAGFGARTGLLVLAGLLVIALGAVLVSGGFRSTPTPRPSPSPTLAPVPTATPLPPSILISPEAAIAVVNPGWPLFDGTNLWVFSGNDAVSRIDPVTNAISLPKAVLPAGTINGGAVANGTDLWVSDFDTSEVYRIDPVSLKVVVKITVGTNPEGLSVGADAVWVANLRGGTATRINPATNKVVATVTVNKAGPGGPHAVGVGFNSVWVSAGNLGSGSGGSVARIDPATNLIQATIQIPANASACAGFAFTEDAVWMSSCFDQPTLVRIDPSTDTVVATIDLHGYGDSLILIDGSPWLVVASVNGIGPATLMRIDPATNTIDRVLSVGNTLKEGGMVVGAGSVWLSNAADNQLLRLPLAAFSP